MNVTAWVITVLLGLNTFYNINNNQPTCPCNLRAISLHPDSDLQCHHGKFYSKKDTSYAKPQGDCTPTPTNIISAYFNCVWSGQCLEYILSAGKFVLLLSLPLYLDHKSRLVGHAIINCLAFGEGTLQMGSQGSLFLLIVVLIGTFLFNWDLSNGDGFFGPATRARAARGRYA